MSHSTPSQALPPHRRPHPSTSVSSSTPRFSPYPPAALRTSLFHPHPRPPSSPFATPRTLALPPPTPSSATPTTSYRIPQNTPSFSFTTHRTSPQFSAKSSTSPKPRVNPFEKLSAGEFDSFIEGLKKKVQNALDPEVERQRKRTERVERQRLRDEKEKEEKESREQEDVFGEVKRVGEEKGMEFEQEIVEETDMDEQEEDDEDENLAEGQQVKIDPRDGFAEDSEEDEPLEFERPQSKGKPVEIVVLDSDEEEEERKEEPIQSRGRQESVDSIVDSIVDDEEFEDEESGVDQEEEEEEGQEDETGFVSSRSPTPNSLPSSSPRKPSPPLSSLSHSHYSHPSIEYPSLTVPSQSLDSPRLSSSPDQPLRTSNDRERSPLFRPRNEGSVSLSAPEDFEQYLSQEEEDEATGEEEEQEENGETEEDVYQGVFDSIVGIPSNNEESIRIEEEQDLLPPPVSQDIKRDPFGRPIRYQDSQEGFLEEEEGFGEDVDERLMDYEVMGGEEPTRRASYGFGLEDLVEASVERVEKGESIEQEQGKEKVEDLGTIELIDSDDEAVEEEPSKIQAPVSNVVPPLVEPLDPLFDLQLQQVLQQAQLDSNSASTSTTSDVLIDSHLLSATTQPAPFAPAADQFLPLSVEDLYNFDNNPTPEEAQGELSDVDQIRARELERLPYLREGEGNAFEEYEEEINQSTEKMASEEKEDLEEESSVQIEDEETENSGRDAEMELEREGKEDSQDEGEFFGEGVPGDETVPGREFESDEEDGMEGGEGAKERDSVEREDSEDFGPRIPWQAKGKGKALPSPSVDSDDLSRLALSDFDPLSSSDDDEDVEDTWKPELLDEYDLKDLERLMEILYDQLENARSPALVARIAQQIQDTEQVYQEKGGQLIDIEEEGEGEGETEEVGERSGTGNEADDSRPQSPDRSAFEAPPSPEGPLSKEDEEANDHILAIASELVNLQSSTTPQPSLRIGSSLDHPERNFSSHFRYEDAPQPKLDDPINLPHPSATATNIDDPVQSEQQNEELNPEIVVADEQQPEEVPNGEEVTMEVDSKEQVDQVPSVKSKEEETGMTIIDDDEDFGSAGRDYEENVKQETELRNDEATTLEDSGKQLPSSSEIQQQPSPPAEPVQQATPPTEDLEISNETSDNTEPLPTTRDKSPSILSADLMPPPMTTTKRAVSFQVPPVDPPVSSISNPTSVLESSSDSPFLPLPPSATSSIARSSGPDLSRFSSHFRFEPNGPPPSLDAPLNLPAPPSVTTSVDEPIEGLQRDEELEPEIEVSNEEEINEPHQLSEMVDLSHETRPKEADDFEQPQTSQQGFLIVDDDEPSVALQQDREEEVTTGSNRNIAHRSRIGATPPPASNEQENMIYGDSAPPQNPDLALSTPPPSPPSQTQDDSSAMTQPISRPSSSPFEDRTPALTPPRPTAQIKSTTSAADEIRFDDFVDEQPHEYASSSSDDDSDAEIAHELLSPHKRAGGVLGFDGGEEEFGETIVIQDDSEEEEQDDQLNSDVEVDLDEVKAALRAKNELEAKNEEENERQVSEAPSSEPISYHSSDDDEVVVNGNGHGLDQVDFDNYDEREYGGGLEEETDQLITETSAPADSAPQTPQPLQIHDVVEPGEWNPSLPIQFGTPHASIPASTVENDEAVTPDDAGAKSSTTTVENGSEDVLAIVEMSKEGEEVEPTLSNDEIAEDVAENAVEALAAATASDSPIPVIEVDPEVIREALHPDSAEQPESTEQGHHSSPPEPRRSPRRLPSALPEELVATTPQPQLPPDALEVPSPIRRSSRLSSIGPTPSKPASPKPESTSQSASKGKRSRYSDENGSPSIDTATPVKKSRRSGHSSRLREEVTEDERPVLAGSSRGGLRLHHHHQAPEPLPVASTSSSHSSSPGSSSKKSEPPLTRSRCHFTRLRIRSFLNKDSQPYEFLVPACALTSSLALETMDRYPVDNLGPVDETMHCRGTPLGGRGFDADAAKLIKDRHPSRLVPDEDVLDIVRRIVGPDMYDEGEVEVLPRVAPPSERGEEMGELEEGEVEEGEIDETESTSKGGGKKRASEESDDKTGKKRR